MGMFDTINTLGPKGVFLVNFLCIVFGGYLITLIATRLLRKILKRSDRVDNAIVAFVVNTTRVLCAVVILVCVLQLFNVPISTIVTVLGAAGAAIALALRDSLANIAGGFMIIITHPFGKGDLISIGQDRGRVDNIDLFLTTLKTTDYRTITIPNGLINTSVVYNESNQDIRRVDCLFTLRYGSDVDKVKEILNNVCHADDIILKDPKPSIGLVEHSERGLVMECLAYCETADYWDAKYYMYETTKKAFEEAGIDMAPQQMDVHISKN